MEIIVQWYLVLGTISFLSKIYWIFKEYKNKEIVGVLKWAALFWGLSGLLVAIVLFPRLEFAQTIGFVISYEQRLKLEVVRGIVFLLATGTTLYGQYIVATAEDDQEALKEIKADTKETIILLLGLAVFFKLLGMY